LRQGPVYQVIAGDITDQIKQGTLQPGERLDSELRLAERYGVSRMTLRQALGELESHGLLVRRHGSGTFVSESRPRHHLSPLGAFHEDVGVDEGEIETRLLVQDVVAPVGEVLSELRLAGGQKAAHVVRLRLVKGKPVALQESWIPYIAAPSLARDGLVEGSLYRTLKERAGIEVLSAEQTVLAAVVDAEAADLLKIARGSPVMKIHRVSRASGGSPIEVGQATMVPGIPFVMRLEQ